MENKKTSFKVKLSDPGINEIVSACYPEYRGRRISISTAIPHRLDSYWDGGHRDYFVFYQLATGKILPVHSNHPFFEANQPRELKALPEGLLLVEHTYFGCEQWITIYVNPENLIKFLPEGGSNAIRA